MKAIIINSSTNIEYRVDLIYEYLIDRGCEVKVIASDFMHASKQRRSSAKHPYTLLKTYPYMKNISVQRLYSHYRFSRDAWSLIKDEEAELLYLVVPQNSNAEIARWYRRRYPSSRIVIDVVDMWPESLPVKGTDMWPFSMWARVRNRNLKYADIIVTECMYYQDKLRAYCAGRPMLLMPWLKRYELSEAGISAAAVAADLIDVPGNKRSISLCYLGAVNNIIDMDRIAEIISLIGSYTKVRLDIIGKGERMPELIRKAEAAGAEVINHGAIYDEAVKKQIMDGCDFGLNIMKSTVCVGLSMKSVDYMAAGLPIINNLPGDTEQLIDEHRIGINIQDMKETATTEQKAELWFGPNGEKLFEAYDRGEIRELFRRSYEAGNIGSYMEEIIGKMIK